MKISENEKAVADDLMKFIEKFQDEFTQFATKFMNEASLEHGARGDFLAGLAICAGLKIESICVEAALFEMQEKWCEDNFSALMMIAKTFADVRINHKKEGSKVWKQ